VDSPKDAYDRHNLWIQRKIHIWCEFMKHIPATFHQNGSAVKDLCPVVSEPLF